MDDLKGFPEVIESIYLKSRNCSVCKQKGQEVKRKELLEKLSLDLSEEELEIRLKALIRSVCHSSRAN